MKSSEKTSRCSFTHYKAVTLETPVKRLHIFKYLFVVRIRHASPCVNIYYRNDDLFERAHYYKPLNCLAARTTV